MRDIKTTKKTIKRIKIQFDSNIRMRISFLNYTFFEHKNE